jgi:acyl carrier protein
MKKEDPSFDAICEIIRDQSQLRPEDRITPDTQFERDLGITGDDGAEILDRVPDYYEIRFTAKSFDLAPNEYLFNSEGFDIVPAFVRSLMRKPEPEVRSFTVGELYEAVLKELVRASGAEKTEAPPVG